MMPEASGLRPAIRRSVTPGVLVPLQNARSIFRQTGGERERRTRHVGVPTTRPTGHVNLRRDAIFGDTHYLRSMAAAIALVWDFDSVGAVVGSRRRRPDDQSGRPSRGGARASMTASTPHLDPLARAGYRPPIQHAKRPPLGLTSDANA